MVEGIMGVLLVMSSLWPVGSVGADVGQDGYVLLDVAIRVVDGD